MDPIITAALIECSTALVALATMSLLVIKVIDKVTKEDK